MTKIIKNNYYFAGFNAENIPVMNKDTRFARRYANDEDANAAIAELSNNYHQPDFAIEGAGGAVAAQGDDIGGIYIDPTSEAAEIADNEPLPPPPADVPPAPEPEGGANGSPAEPEGGGEGG